MEGDPSKLRFENGKLVGINSSCKKKGVPSIEGDPSKLRFENGKLVLINSSELDLTYEFSIYS